MYNLGEHASKLTRLMKDTPHWSPQTKREYGNDQMISERHIPNVINEGMSAIQKGRSMLRHSHRDFLVTPMVENSGDQIQFVHAPPVVLDSDVPRGNKQPRTLLNLLTATPLAERRCARSSRERQMKQSETVEVWRSRTHLERIAGGHNRWPEVGCFVVGPDALSFCTAWCYSIHLVHPYVFAHIGLRTSSKKSTGVRRTGRERVRIDHAVMKCT